MANRTYPIKINVGTRRVGFTHEEWGVILNTVANQVKEKLCVQVGLQESSAVFSEQVVEVTSPSEHVVSSNKSLGMSETFTETM